MTALRRAQDLLDQLLSVDDLRMNGQHWVRDGTRELASDELEEAEFAVVHPPSPAMRAEEGCPAFGERHEMSAEIGRHSHELDPTTTIGRRIKIEKRSPNWLDAEQRVGIALGVPFGVAKNLALDSLNALLTLEQDLRVELLRSVTHLGLHVEVDRIDRLVS